MLSLSCYTLRKPSTTTRVKFPAFQHRYPMMQTVQPNLSARVQYDLDPTVQSTTQRSARTVVSAHAPLGRQQTTVSIPERQQKHSKPM